MQKDIRGIHEEVLTLLESRYHLSEEFTFSLRKSNRAGKLEQGFWFHGTDDFLAVSFWSGMDWKARIPNISFIINSDGRTFLTMTASDSKNKMQFLETHFLSHGAHFGMQKQNSSYTKSFSNFEPQEYLQSLFDFIDNEKWQIDNVVREYGRDISDDPADRIGFISPDEFESSLRKIRQYRSYHFEENRDYANSTQLMGFQIKDFGPIKDTGFIRIEHQTQWIFLVGENGTGKTSLLKAIGCGLTHTKFPFDELSSVKFQLANIRSGVVTYERFGNYEINKRKPLVSGFCSYGAARLRTSSKYKSAFSFTKSLGKAGLTSSLFDVNTVLIDIEEQFRFWNRNPKMKDILLHRKHFVRELLIDILPNIHNIKYSEDDQWTETIYFEKDDENGELSPVTFEMLASGLKSLIAMIGDMMMRLFNQQPHVVDPSELNGVVLIDEIDIHLHPKLQKSLVEQLTITFPKVQFIVSSHSPIPLLGAPLNSQFFKVERNAIEGVILMDVSEIRVDRLLPNTILSSELFGMNQLFSKEFKDSKVRTEDTYNELLFNDLVKRDLRKIADRLREKQ